MRDRESFLKLEPARYLNMSALPAPVGYMWKTCPNDLNHESLILKSNSNRVDCPICSGKRILSGFNDLKTLYPKLAKSWSSKNEQSASDISPFSHTHFWWKESCGHEFKSPINRRQRGDGCPVCSGKQIILGVNDFASQRPDLVKEWDFAKNKISPTEVTVGSKRKVYWVSHGHMWSAPIQARAIAEQGCSVCAGKTINVGINDFLSNNSTLSREWNYKKNEKDPDQYVKKSNSQVWWSCEECSHEWVASINARQQGRGCIRCSRAYSKLERIFLKEILSKTTREVLLQKKPLRLQGHVYELDFWIPSLSLAFEVQDFATHSKNSDNEAGLFRGGPLIKKGPTYHELKRTLAKDQLGVTLIDVWQDQIRDGSYKDIIGTAIETRVRFNENSLEEIEREPN